MNEVRQRFFEVWNEPNLDVFGSGKQDDYFKLYRYTAEAVKSVDKALKAGGSATAENAGIVDFIGFCTKSQLPADLISTHHYPADAFRLPYDDTEAQLSKNLRDVLREQAEEVRRHSGDRPVYYTEMVHVFESARSDA